MTQTNISPEQLRGQILTALGINQSKRKQSKWPRLLASAFVFAVYSALAALASMLMFGAWHDSYPAVPALGFLMIWATLVVLRLVYSVIVWKDAT